MAVVDSIEKLVQERLDCLLIKSFFARTIEKLLQILVQELENKSQFLVRVNHVMQFHDVLVLQLF